MWRFIAVLAVLCAGCTKFDHPIVAEDIAKVDSRLLGNWVLENEEGRYELTVRADGGAAVVSTTASPPGEEQKSGQIRFVTARVGRRDYGSARGGGDLPEDSWTIFHYEVRRDRVEIVFFDDDQWNRAVERGELPGTLEKSWRVFARISASPERLRAWLARHPGAARRDPDERWIFRRPAD